jgi:hypothetical protein
MPRLYGPGHFTEDPYSQVVSPHGIPVDDLVAVLQKEIRRSRIDNAVLAAYEMFTTSADVAQHLWRRLRVIAVEDVGMGLPLGLRRCCRGRFCRHPGQLGVVVGGLGARPARPTAVSRLAMRIPVSRTVSSAITSAVRAMPQRRPGVSIEHRLHSGIRKKSALSLIYDDCAYIRDYVPDMPHLNSVNLASLPAVLRLDSARRGPDPASPGLA